MDKIKINLDREKLSSEYIHSKQNFNKVQNQVNMQRRIVKNTWFYGAVGLASVATFVFIAFNTKNTKKHDNNSTLSKKTLIDTKQETLDNQKSANVFLASINTPTTEVFTSTIKDLDVKPTVVAMKKEVESREQSANKEMDPIEQPIIVKTKEIEKSIKSEKVNYLPRISGVYNGEISQSKLCNVGIDVNPSVQVLNFSIHYSTVRGDKIQLIEGNKLPTSICQEMEQYGIDQMIFITDIIGSDKNGKLMNFTSMNLVAVLD